MKNIYLLIMFILFDCQSIIAQKNIKVTAGDNSANVITDSDNPRNSKSEKTDNYSDCKNAGNDNQPDNG
jgi:hypothetical protein